MVVIDLREYGDDKLDLIGDFAGFSTTTAGAIEVIRNQGRVVQVGMGKLEATIPITPFIMKQVQLLGSMGGDAADLEAVYSMYEAGTLEPTTSATTFEGIPEGLDELRQGRVRGRLVAVLGD